MTTERKQSAISEVRDQLSLDFADGEYLNIIGQNLGMSRPLLGFSDDSWRAVVKILALEYKQIANKFRDVLEIIFGPRITEVGTLAANVEIGDAEFVMNDTSNLPQLGTLIFDEGSADEETLAYCYIDRVTNTVFLETNFAAAHLAREFDSEEPILALDGTSLILPKTNEFPTTSYPYPVVLGRGTDNEEVVQVTNNSAATSTLTLSSPPVNSHTALRVGDVFNQLNQAYFPNSSFAELEDSTFFPEEGYVKLFATGDATGTPFTLTANTPGTLDKTITLAASTFLASSLVGFEIVFTGNVTADLAGATRRVVSNTDSVVTLDKDFTAEGSAPAIGDEFSIHPIVQYTSLDYSTNTITLRRPILEENLTVSLNSTVELMEIEETAALSPVKFVGTGWDVIQSTPRLVELLIPEDIRDPNDLRSSSHLHDDTLGAFSTTNSVQVDPGDTVVESASFAAFPDAGTLELDPGTGNAERVPYGKYISSLRVYAPGEGIVPGSGSSSLTLVNSRSFPPSGSIVIDEGRATEETLAYSANDTATGTLTLTGTTIYEHRVGEIVKCDTEVGLEAAAANTHVIGTTIEFYNPEYGSTGVPIGDYWQQQQTWPGPYVYSLDEPAATGTVALTSLSVPIPGTTTLSIGQAPGRTCISVNDGLPLIYIGGVFDAIVSDGTVNEETVQVNSVHAKGRATTTLAALSNIGDTQIQVASLNLASIADGAAFPNANGYRIVIDEGTANREVAYVIGTDGVDVIFLESPLTIAHSISDPVDLMSDFVAVASISKSHVGDILVNDRSTALAGDNAYFLREGLTTGAETFKPLLDSITLASVAGLDIDGGNVIFNFGSGNLPVESVLDAPLTGKVSTLVSVASSDSFPAPTSIFVAIIGVGTPNEERVLVASNDVGLDRLTLDYPVQYDHAIGETVRFEPGKQEAIEYSQIDGSDLRFIPETVLQYTHYPVETVVDSSATSDPRDNGYDFPLRMPSNIEIRLRYLLDIIRAAGVQVELITKR